MKFALFYEIPVPRPWAEDSELVAYQNTLEQAIAGDRYGWHAFWTVEHHFLQEYSHCSNPEVLYGAIAARTERIRLGYGVRLMPKPYNHPVRTAESVAVLDLISEGGWIWARAARPPGPSSRASASTPPRAARCGRRPSGTSSAAGPTRSTSSTGSTGRCPGAGCSPSRGRSRTRRCGVPRPATRATPRWASSASGLCSFAVGLPPSEVKRKIDIYRDAVERCTEPHRRLRAQPGRHLHHGHLRPRPRRGDRGGPGVLRVVPQDRRPPDRHADRLDGRAQARSSGTYSYAADMKKTDDEGTLDLLNLEYLVDANACVLGTPEECLEACRRTRRPASTCCSAW